VLAPSGQATHRWRHPADADPPQDLRDLCERVLRANWREGAMDGVPYAFTCPSTPRYRHMWHWDSCFHAIAWRHVDVARARAELRTVLRSGRGDGFLPHTVFWDAPPGWRRAPFYATNRILGDVATWSIGPPVLVLAWELVAAASDDEPGFATEALPALAAHLDWLWHERDLDGDGLLTIILPDESGLDDSPMYDEVFGSMVHHRPGYFRLVERCRRRGWNARRYAARFDEHVEDLLVSVLFALSCDALARLGGAAYARFADRARQVERALCERAWDEGRGLFWPLAGRDERPVRVATWASLAPLALPGIPEPMRRRLVEALQDPARFHAPVGIPSVSQDEPTFRPGFDMYRCWRGPSWVNTAWLLVPALRELGEEALAGHVVDSLVGAIRREGLREYYDPRDGTGLAARDFGWSTLILDLA
jgi:hypothetical protein